MAIWLGETCLCTKQNISCVWRIFKFVFLGAFAKLRKATIIFVVSVRLSVRQHGTTRLPLDWFSWNLISDYFFFRNFKFNQIMTGITGTLHKNLCTFIITEAGIAQSLQAGRSGDRIPVAGEIFRTRPDRLWGPPSLAYNRYRVFPGGKAAGAWRWSPTRN